MRRAAENIVYRIVGVATLFNGAWCVAHSMPGWAIANFAIGGVMFAIDLWASMR